MFRLTFMFALNSLSKIENVKIFRDFSWEGGGTLPQNSKKPSRDLWEATLLRRTQSVQRLARSFGTNKHIDKYTSCYFSIRIAFIVIKYFTSNCHLAHIFIPNKIVMIDRIWKEIKETKLWFFWTHWCIKCVMSAAFYSGVNNNYYY